MGNRFQFCTIPAFGESIYPFSLHPSKSTETEGESGGDEDDEPSQSSAQKKYITVVVGEDDEGNQVTKRMLDPNVTLSLGSPHKSRSQKKKDKRREKREAAQ